ncbi:MAG: hypothetical protein CM15mV7_2690 [uncultured marine virus]|nr:MAG: hypothetical protein CM15mV7_2690 [uncultured marine virus]
MQESASFKVSLEVKGKTTGAQGEAFMNFFKKQTKPILMPRRIVPKSNASGNAKVWNCNDGTVDGRCYRNPANSADIIFIPIGGDENTYDYNSAGGFSEVQQLQLWMGGNVSGTTSSTTNNTGSGGNISYNRLNVNCGSYPGAECWDTYTRGSGNTTGPLDVYSGYNASGNGIAGQRWWEISAFGRTNPWCTSCTSGNFSGQGVGLTFVNDISIAVNPQRVDENNNMRLGPYDGNMTVRNWLSGSTVALGRALNNNGNPYFDECSYTVPQGRPYTAGLRFTRSLINGIWISKTCYVIKGLPDSGHGLCLPSTVHSVQACGSPPIPYSIVIKNKTCWWPPQPLIPIFPITPDRAMVLVNRIPVMVFGDAFTPHIAVCTNIIIYMCPCGKGVCPIPTPIPCSLLTIEDNGGIGHIRVCNATTLTVFVHKRPLARILDPLGVGIPGFLSMLLSYCIWASNCVSILVN